MKHLEIQRQKTEAMEYDLKSLGQVAYEAHAAEMLKTSGIRLCSWEKLQEPGVSNTKIRSAWQAAAKAVVDALSETSRRPLRIPKPGK